MQTRPLNLLQNVLNAVRLGVLNMHIPWFTAYPS